MFDVSWGETFVLFGLGVTLIGRKDLPSEYALQHYMHVHGML